MKVYKFHPMTNIEHTLDIFINRRFYASKFDNLNDPMEGYFRSDPKLDRAFRKELQGDLGRTRICSFCREHTNPVLWAYYANGFKGVCFEVELDESICPPIAEVNYDDRDLYLPGDSESFRGVFHLVILTKKLTAWVQEKEVRVLTDREYVEGPCAQITAIMLGRRTPKIVRRAILGCADNELDVWTTGLDKGNGKIIKAKLIK